MTNKLINTNKQITLYSEAGVCGGGRPEDAYHSAASS